MSQPGSPITWSGEWEGKPHQDEGELLQAREFSKNWQGMLDGLKKVAEGH